MKLKYLLPSFLFICSLFFLVNIAHGATLSKPEGLAYECSADGTKVKLKWKRVYLASEYQLRVDKITESGKESPTNHEWFRPEKGDQNPKSDGSECPSGSFTKAATEACQTLNIDPNSRYKWSMFSMPTDSPANSKEDGPEFTCVPQAIKPQTETITLNVKLSPVCEDGKIVSGVNTRVDWGLWPTQAGASKGIEWQTDQTQSGTHQIRITSTDNLNNVYLKMFIFNKGWVSLERTKELIDPTIEYGTFFGGQNTLKWKRNDLVQGNYTFRFKAPTSFCQKPLPSAPSTTSTDTTTGAVTTPTSPTITTQPSSAPVPVTNTAIPSPSAPTVKKAVKIVINDQDVTDKDFAKIKVTNSNTATTIDLRVEITYSDGSVDRSVIRFNYNPPAQITSGSAPTNLQIKCDPSGKKVLITWDADAKATNGYLLRLDKNPPSWNYDRVNNDDAPILAGRTDVDFSIDPNTPYLADVLTIPAGFTDAQINKYNPADNLHLKQSFNCAAQSTPTTAAAPSSAPVVQTNPPASTVKSITCQKLERDGRNSGKILAPDTVTGVSPSQAFNIVASIIGDDGRRDNIKWSATGGTFNGQWDVVDWVAPKESGEYKVSMSIDGVDQPNCTTKFKVTGTTLGVSVQAKSGLLDIFKGWLQSIFYPQKSTTSLSQPQNVSCLTGIDGNSGNNYCSNYHQTASKCKPGLGNTFADGCTK